MVASTGGEWSRSLTQEEPGYIRQGPVTYVVSQRPRLGSALVGFAVTRSARVRVLPLLGLSLVQNTPTVRYSFEPATAPGSEQTNLAWTSGFDVAFSGRRLVLRAPRVRVHYLAGVKQGDFGFGAPPVIWSVGTSLGWRF